MDNIMVDEYDGATLTGVLTDPNGRNLSVAQARGAYFPRVDSRIHRDTSTVEPGQNSGAIIGIDALNKHASDQGYGIGPRVH
jgi:hypothetical protein